MTKIALNSEVKNEFVTLKTCPWKNILRQKNSELRRKMENDLVAFQDVLVNKCLKEEARTFNSGEETFARQAFEMKRGITMEVRLQNL